VLLADVGSTRCWTSPDALTWTPQTIGARTWTAVCFGDSQFVAVSADGYVATSPDGETWTEQTPASAKAWWDVCWTGTSFIAVANSSEDIAVIMTSPDGETWTGRDASFLYRQFTKVVAVNGICIALHYGTGIADYDISTNDGETWTQQIVADVPGAGDAIGATTQGNTIIVVVGDEGNYRQSVCTTTNGTTWTVTGPETSNGFASIVFGSGLLVAAFKKYSGYDLGIGQTPSGIAASSQGSEAGWGDTYEACRCAHGNGVFIVLSGYSSAATYLRCDD
jgi:hypothetical protein